MKTLIDVNVLIALIDGDHVHHRRAHDWFEHEAERGWTTCPLTQNGLLRVLGNPRYPNSPGGPAHVADILDALIAHPRHEFWPDDVSMLDKRLFVRDTLGPSARLTDSYLLALAVSKGGRFATLDLRLSTAGVIGGKAALVVI
ncbi:MAG: TA system VapC family ribonuclease toxin [Hansschlegelia sp.]